MDQQNIKELTIEFLKNTPAETDVERAFELYEKAQKIALSVCGFDDQKDPALVKMGTILSLNLFGILLGGKKAKELTEDDWAGIAKEVTDKAVLMDGMSYGVYIFDLYADYIDQSANVLSTRAFDQKREKQIQAIRKLSEDLREKKTQLLNREIKEAAYTEECLWICLDAMIKCLATYIGCFTGAEFSELIVVSATLAFEYGRLKLYQKEQALLAEYIQNQYLLDEQLQMKLDSFRKELQEESERFSVLVNNAFDSDFRNALTGSVDLARAAGVREEEILKTVDEIDDFFLACNN